MLREFLKWAAQLIVECLILYLVFINVTLPMQNLRINRTASEVYWTGTVWYSGVRFNMSYAYNVESRTCTVIARYGRSNVTYNSLFREFPPQPWAGAINKSKSITLCHF